MLAEKQVKTGVIFISDLRHCL